MLLIFIAALMGHFLLCNFSRTFCIDCLMSSTTKASMFHCFGNIWKTAKYVVF